MESPFLVQFFYLESWRFHKAKISKSNKKKEYYFIVISSVGVDEICVTAGNNPCVKEVICGISITLNSSET
jgi:hypothetical protein